MQRKVSHSYVNAELRGGCGTLTLVFEPDGSVTVRTETDAPTAMSWRLGTFLATLADSGRALDGLLGLRDLEEAP